MKLCAVLQRNLGLKWLWFRKIGLDWKSLQGDSIYGKETDTPLKELREQIE